MLMVKKGVDFEFVVFDNIVDVFMFVVSEVVFVDVGD